MAQQKTTHCEPATLNILYEHLEVGGVTLEAINLRRNALQQLVRQAEIGNRIAIRLLTRALKRSLIQRALMTWTVSNDMLIAHSDEATTHEICVLLYKSWLRAGYYRAALSCVSNALFAFVDTSRQYIDRQYRAIICYELGEYERAIDLIQDLVGDLQKMSRNGATCLPLSPESQLHLHLLKCKAFEAIGRPNWAETYYCNTTTEFAERAGLNLPDWLPTNLRDRVSQVVCTSPEQLAQAAV